MYLNVFTDVSTCVYSAPLGENNIKMLNIKLLLRYIWYELHETTQIITKGL